MSSSVTSIADWQKRVAELVPSLSPSQAKALGLISYGIVLFDGCGMTRLCNGLGKVEQVPAGRLRQRLREFYYEAQAKRGKKRRVARFRRRLARATANERCQTCQQHDRHGRSNQ